MNTTAVMVRIDPALKLRIETSARSNDRTVSQELRRTLVREYAPEPTKAEASASA